MAATAQENTPSKNVTKQPRSEDSTSLLFKMVGGVLPVLQLQRRSTNTETRRPANRMVKVDLWPIKCITSKVREQLHVLQHLKTK